MSVAHGLNLTMLWSYPLIKPYGQLHHFEMDKNVSGQLLFYLFIYFICVD